MSSLFLVNGQRGEEAVGAAFAQGRGGAEAPEGERAPGGAQPGESAAGVVERRGNMLLHCAQ